MSHSDETDFEMIEKSVSVLNQDRINLQSNIIQNTMLSDSQNSLLSSRQSDMLSHLKLIIRISHLETQIVSICTHTDNNDDDDFSHRIKLRELTDYNEKSL